MSKGTLRRGDTKRGADSRREPRKSAARYVMMLFLSVLILMLLSYFSNNRLNLQAEQAYVAPNIQRTIVDD